MRLQLEREELLRIAHRFSDQPGTLLLHSGGEGEVANFSILVLFPIDRIEVRSGRLWRNGELAREGNPWELLEREVGPLKGDDRPEWVGLIGYEMGVWADESYRIPTHAGPLPNLYLQRSAITFRLDHSTGWADLWIEEGVSPDSEAAKGERSALPAESKESYLAKIEAIQEEIRSGEVYQLCLSHERLFTGSWSPFDLFLKWIGDSPSSFSAYLCLEGGTLVSISPERFLSHHGGVLESRPIKGTTVREEAEALLQSEKERAELMMIVDLVRNDLGRVSQPGTVEVVDLRRCEPHGALVHTLSVIRSKPLPELHPVQLIRFCFPPASVTGCPKLAAMRLIEQFEGRWRGPYTGAIGYLAANGEFDWSVVIRTAELYGNQARIQLGGAITIDSEPEKEWEEVVRKGAFLAKRLSP